MRFQHIIDGLIGVLIAVNVAFYGWIAHEAIWVALA
jgi:hypothetical protein